MKILVKTSTLRGIITKGLADHDAEYSKQLKLYKTKLREYKAYVNKAVAKIIQSGKPQYLKSPPHIPSWLREQFKERIFALDIHEGIEIEMEDDELARIRDGIRTLNTQMAAGTATLSNLRY